MIVYLSDDHRPLAGVPSHLLERRMGELLIAWRETWNVVCYAVDERGICALDISHASKSNVFAFLDAANCVAVDLQPQDLPCLAGARSIEVLAAADLLNSDEAVRQGCQRLTPDEILSTVEELVILALNAGAAARAASDEYISQFPADFAPTLQHERDMHDQEQMQRLRNAGFDVPDADAVNLEPPAAAEQPHPEDYRDDFNRVVVDPFQQFANE
jgi:hypothetical protein